MGRVRLSRRMLRGEQGASSIAAAKVGMSLAGIAVGSVVLAFAAGAGKEEDAELPRRALAETCSRFVPVIDGELTIKGIALCDDALEFLPLSIFIMFYMFWALAIVVDEYFVPIMDWIVMELEVDEDVAGATFMAAGGSAPEFFTNLISTIESTGTGFGTIMGSAIFNVLFVISMCGFFSRDRDEVIRRRALLEQGKLVKEPWPYKPLPLAWWPLLRDSAYYVLGLIMLAIFYFCISDGLLPGPVCNTTGGGLITWYESLILLLIYCGYWMLMWVQAPLKRFVETRLPFIIPRDQRKGGARHEDAVKAARGPGYGKHLAVVANGVDVERQAGAARDDEADSDEVPALRPTESVSSHASARESRLKQLQKQASVNFQGQQEDGDADSGAQLPVAFSNALSRRGLLVNDDLGHAPPRHSSFSGAAAVGLEGDKDDGDVEVVVPRMRPTSWAGDPERAGDTRYRVVNAVLYALVLPILAGNALIWFNFDSLVAMDSKVKKGLALLYAFFASLIVIGVYTWLMVYSAETMAATWGIPDTVLGFTILAAGTSTPDLLSSIFVARLGYGDMAVSSSLGSNIFDILVSLPVPWLVSVLVNNRPLPVTTGAVGYSLAVIVAMVVALVAIVIQQDWKLTYKASWAMLVLYFVFITAVVAAELA